jgi:hypothetical protein
MTLVPTIRRNNAKALSDAIASLRIAAKKLAALDNVVLDG